MSKTIDGVLQDKRLLGAALDDPDSWQTWFAALRAAFGLELNREQRRRFTAISGGRAAPTQRVREFWCLIGRKGGKSRMAAAIACYVALFCKHKLARGEKGLVLVLAMSMDQAKVVFDYCVGFLMSSPVLCKEVESMTATEIRLKNGIVIATHANSFRSVRGRTLVACIFDEVAYWRDSVGAIPDVETYTAIIPSLLTTKGMLIGISSTYRRAGLLYSKYEQFFGTDDADTLVIKGGTTTFNLTVDEEHLAALRAADPTAAASEWDSEFRDDLTGLFDGAVINGAVDRNRPLELPPRDDIIYKAYTDSSGGATSGDAYSFCIGHMEGEQRVIDVVRGRTGPFNPRQVVEEYANLCRAYRVTAVTGDRYGKELNQQLWRDQRIDYFESKLWAWETFLEALVPFNQGIVNLPPAEPLISELKSLQRVANRTGKESVEHPRGTHDDLANAVCGCLYVLGAMAKYAEPPIVAAVIVGRYGEDISAAPPATGSGLNGPNYSMKDSWSPKW